MYIIYYIVTQSATFQKYLYQSVSLVGEMRPEPQKLNRNYTFSQIQTIWNLEGGPPK